MTKMEALGGVACVSYQTIAFTLRSTCYVLLSGSSQAFRPSEYSNSLPHVKIFARHKLLQRGKWKCHVCQCSMYQSCFCASAAEHGVVSIPLFSYQPFVISQIQKTNLQPETGTMMDHVLSVNNSSCTCFCQQFLVMGKSLKNPKVCCSKKLEPIFWKVYRCSMKTFAKRPNLWLQRLWLGTSAFPQFITSKRLGKNIATIKKCVFHLQKYKKKHVLPFSDRYEYWNHHHFQVPKKSV